MEHCARHQHEVHSLASALFSSHPTTCSPPDFWLSLSPSRSLNSTFRTYSLPLLVPRPCSQPLSSLCLSLGPSGLAPPPEILPSLSPWPAPNMPSFAFVALSSFSTPKPPSTVKSVAPLAPFLVLFLCSLFAFLPSCCSPGLSALRGGVAPLHRQRKADALRTGACLLRQRRSTEMCQGGTQPPSPT